MYNVFQKDLRAYKTLLQKNYWSCIIETSSKEQFQKFTRVFVLLGEFTVLPLGALFFIFPLF